MRRSLLVAAVLGLAGLAHAQTTTTPALDLKVARGDVTDTTFAKDSVAVGPGDCDGTLTVFWTAVAPPVCPNSNLSLWVTDKTSCKNTPADTDFALPDQVVGQGTTSGRVTLSVADLPGFVTKNIACGATGDVPHLVCGSVRNANLSVTCDNNATILNDTEPPKVSYDTVPPAPPTLSALRPGNAKLTAQVTLPSDATGVRLAWAPVGSVDGGSVETDAGTATGGERDFALGEALTLTGLVNGTTYTVTARALDEAGNASDPTAPIEGTPVFSPGYCDVVVDDQGKSVCTQGCSSAGGGVVGAVAVALMLGGLLLARRRVS